jgi:signal transduction histidine kinase
MTLLPRSLFSRLVVVLLSGLLVAQIAGLVVQLRERGQVLSRTTGIQAAQRIADIVKVLDPLPPDERGKMVAILSAPPLLIRLNGDISRLNAGDSNNAPHAAIFEAMLRRMLGESWPITVAMTEAPPWSPPANAAAFKGAQMHEGMPFRPGMHFSPHSMSFIASVRLHDGALVTFDSRQPAEALEWPYRLLLTLAILLAAVIIVSLVAVRWATQPLKTLADAAEELGKDINRPPLKETGPTEVVRAARAFNTMQERLLRYVTDRTRMLAAMSHDLKTPIARLRLRAEMLHAPEDRLKFSRDLEELERMVRHTLEYLRGVEIDEAKRLIDIDALVQSLQMDMQELGASVLIDGAAKQPFRAKPQSLKRCLTNLLENAVRYGKSARVLIDDNEDRLEIRVLDEGPGLPESLLDRVFDPYYRVDPSRRPGEGSTGLGLTIARAIAESHGGTLTLHNRPRGGLEALLCLPRREVSVTESR